MSFDVQDLTCDELRRLLRGTRPPDYTIGAPPLGQLDNLITNLDDATKRLCEQQGVRFLVFCVRSRECWPKIQEAWLENEEQREEVENYASRFCTLADEAITQFDRFLDAAKDQSTGVSKYIEGYRSSVELRRVLVKLLLREGIDAVYQELLDRLNLLGSNVPKQLDKVKDTLYRLSWYPDLVQDENEPKAIVWREFWQTTCHRLLHELLRICDEFKNEKGPWALSARSHFFLVTAVVDDIERALVVARWFSAGVRYNRVTQVVCILTKVLTELRDEVLLPLHVIASKVPASITLETTFDRLDEVPPEVEKEAKNTITKMPAQIVRLYLDTAKSLLLFSTAPPGDQDAFVPSPYLADQIRRNAVSPLPGLLEEPDLKVVQTKIGEVFEDYLKSRVRRVADRKDVDQICLSSERTFEGQICVELADRLGLESEDLRGLFDTLFAQVWEYVQLFHPSRPWGRLEIVDDELLIQLASTS